MQLNILLWQGNDDILYKANVCFFWNDGVYLPRKLYNDNWVFCWKLEPIYKEADNLQLCLIWFSFHSELFHLLWSMSLILIILLLIIISKSCRILLLIILLLITLYRFVRPSEMSEHRINEYIEGKYGKIGVDRYATFLFNYSRSDV